MPPRLTGYELLSYVGLLRGLNEQVVERRAEELLGVLDLSGAGSTVVADCSTGMRKKIALAVALLHGPRVLVLDEPFDPSIRSPQPLSDQFWPDFSRPAEQFFSPAMSWHWWKRCVIEWQFLQRAASSPREQSIRFAAVGHSTTPSPIWSEPTARQGHCHGSGPDSNAGGGPGQHPQFPVRDGLTRGRRPRRFPCCGIDTTGGLFGHWFRRGRRETRSRW